MKRCFFFILSFTFLLLSCSLFSSSAFAYEVPKEVRIGLEYKYKNVSTVPVSNQQIGIGVEVNGVFQADVMLHAQKGFSVTKGSGYYVAVSELFFSYESAQNAASSYQSAGFSAVPAYLGSQTWVIYLSGFSSYQDAVQQCFAITAVKGSEAKAVESSNKIMQLKDGETTLLVFGEEINPQMIAFDQNAILQLSDRSYRGRIEFGCYASSLITAVNVVGLEEYLYGVIPSEMPASYETEALKAQAVAARSYTLSQMGVHKENGYELCDNTNCQVYKGYSGENAATNAAVDATKGIVAYYHDQPINAVFCASSGGYTENSENVWLEALPYLRAVPELKEPDVNKWTRTFTESDLNYLLSAQGKQIGSITDILIKGTNGRVQELHLVGTNGTSILKKEEIRSFFNPKGGSLESRMFQINGKTCSTISPGTAQNYAALPETLPPGSVYVEGVGIIKLEQADDNYVIGGDGSTPILLPPSENNSPNQNNQPNQNQGTNQNQNNQSLSSSGSTANGSGTFLFTGTGSGHGVGMSQKGARGLAQLGYSFEEILYHYYTGITLK